MSTSCTTPYWPTMHEQMKTKPKLAEALALPLDWDIDTDLSLQNIKDATGRYIAYKVKPAHAKAIIQALTTHARAKAALESTLAYIQDHFGMSPAGQEQRNKCRDMIRAVLKDMGVEK